MLNQKLDKKLKQLDQKLMPIVTIEQQNKNAWDKVDTNTVHIKKMKEIIVYKFDVQEKS